MSLSDYTSSTGLDKNLVDRVLEQGQRLRNSMVQTILNNDPFDSEVLYPSIATSSENLKNRGTLLSLSERFSERSRTQNQKNAPETNRRVQGDENMINMYLRGDFMTKKDENETLACLKEMPVMELCKYTNRTFCSYQDTCDCGTCTKYYKEDLCCDLKRANSKQNTPKDGKKASEATERKYTCINSSYFSYADSLRVFVHSLALNKTGNKRIFSEGTRNNTSKLSQTFFVEYKIPELLAKRNKFRSTLNSGLDFQNSVRLCSRRIHDEAIYFKQASTHEIVNIDKIDLSRLEIRFKISCRTLKSKFASEVGICKFNLSDFEVAKHLACTRDFPILLNEHTPIVLGVLKVTLQLGCGKLYFGKEFLEAVNIHPVSESISASDTTNDTQEEHLRKTTKPKKSQQISQNLKSKNQDKIEPLKETQNFNKMPLKKSPIKHKEDSSRNKTEKDTPRLNSEENSNSEKLSENCLVVEKVVPKIKPDLNVKEKQKQILFGFVYISEAHFLGGPTTSYVSFRPFCQEFIAESRLVPNDFSPVYNCFQRIPLIYQDDLLEQFRDNVMILEFWEKDNTKSKVFGTAKIPLHQFYISYRHPDVVKYLLDNKLPIIGCDWWETILTPYTEHLVGQVQILLALGTEQQINNLEEERGFKSQIVKANLPKIVARNQSLAAKKQDNTFIAKLNPVQKQKLANRFDTNIRNKVIYKEQAQTTKLTAVEKLDKGTQYTMDKTKAPTEEPKSQSAQEALGDFLNKILAQQKTCVESSTNTEEIIPETPTQAPQLTKTSQLLETLQTALKIDPPTTKPPVVIEVSQSPPPNKYFKVQIEIREALHLPVRKKCKSKKSNKNSKGKVDDSLLPSTYVTFETLPGAEVKMTNLVPKNSSPKWNYVVEVSLPIEYLINSQKRLIFKVWRKSTNTVMQPNLETDIILGFAALDLSVLLAGLPNVQGWFNIVDFASKCNGQINIHVKPMEDIKKYQEFKETCTNAMELSPPLPRSNPTSARTEPKKVTLVEPNQSEEPGEALSRALKRKFSELDEITQRLRLRLSDVTKESSSDDNDEFSEDFEHDINTLCIEEDFDLINFSNEASKLNETTEKTNNTHSLMTGAQSIASTSSDFSISDMLAKTPKEQLDELLKGSEIPGVTSLDRQLLDGRQKIDTLLEKLSLLSGSNELSHRYVSGCSVTNSEARSQIDTEAILKDLDRNSRPNVQTTSRYDFGVTYDSGSSSQYTPVSSDTSLITSVSEFRAAPEGGSVIETKK